MEIELAETIAEALDNAGIEAKVREEYSGRGMYGNSTAGVVFDGSLGDVLRAVINYAHEFCIEDEGWPEPKFDCNRIRTDSMGLGTIIY